MGAGTIKLASKAMIEIPKNEVSELDISGLTGRLLKLPAPKDKDADILLVYGVHSSMERMYTTAKFHSRYGRVWMPDLPGFGGMDSFYQIGREPNLDDYADYVYTFMRTYKLDYKKIRIVAMSFGFLVVTRMLQKYPELVENVEFVVSFVGFGKTADFSVATLKKPYVKAAMNFGITKGGSTLISSLLFNKLSLRVMFAFFWVFNPNPKYRHETKQERSSATKMELDLWSSNDARTKFYTYKVLSDFDLTKGQKPINLDLHDIITPTDQYFDSKSVSATLSKLYKRSSTYMANLKLHAPSVIGNETQVANIYPDAIKKILDK